MELLYGIMVFTRWLHVFGDMRARVHVRYVSLSPPIMI